MDPHVHAGSQAIVDPQHVQYRPATTQQLTTQQLTTQQLTRQQLTRQQLTRASCSDRVVRKIERLGHREVGHAAAMDVHGFTQGTLLSDRTLGSDLS